MAQINECTLATTYTMLRLEAKWSKFASDDSIPSHGTDVLTLGT